MRYFYFLEINDDEFEVCAKFYIDTLNISKTRVAYFHKHLKSEQDSGIRESLQGKHIKKVSSTEDLDVISIVFLSLLTVAASLFNST